MPMNSDEDMSRKEETETGSKIETPEIEEGIEALKRALSLEKSRADANLAGWQRAQADFVNFRRRSEQEKEETIKFANAALLLGVLPILDDLERAMNSIPEELAHLAWVEGVKLISENMKKTLEAQGLSPLKPEGEAFDPCIHEAVMSCAGREGMVVRELTRGYKFRDRLLRPSGVMVGSGEEKKEATESK